MPAVSVTCGACGRTVTRAAEVGTDRVRCTRCEFTGVPVRAPAHEWNLDDESEARMFVRASQGVGNRKRLTLELGRAYGECVTAAVVADMRHYAQLRLLAGSLRQDGRVATAMARESLMDEIYQRLPEAVRW